MSDPASSAPPIGNDPVYDERLWSFSAFFPPPYRVLLLASIGLLLFAVNVKVLQFKGIDLFALFRADRAEKRRSIPPASASHRSSNASSSSSSSSSGDGGAAILPTTTNNRSSAAEAGAGSLASLPLFAFGMFQLAWSLLGWASYRFYVDSLVGDPKGRHAQALQGFAVMGAFLALVWPGNLFFKPMRKAFGRSVLLILSPSLTQHITFSDVVLADILTSFAKVLGDVWLTACFLVPRKEHHTWWNGKGSVAVPLLISLPYAIRFRQCLSEYCVSQPVDGTKSKRPLWNAAKYASAFPVIWLSAWYEADKHPDAHHAWVTRYTLWLLAVCVNSIFSFWWDVTNDWGLSLLLPANMGSVAQVAQNAVHLHRRGMSYMPLPLSEEAEALPMSQFRPDEKAAPQTSLAVPPATNPSGGASSSTSHRRTLSTMERMLRPAPALLFPTWMYQLAILLDLLLRFFWSLKLSSHLHHLVEWQGGMFSMELLEIVRRWVWVFFRVEWEVVRRRERARVHGMD
ncbi:related to ERD1 protein, required for retention of luminal ER [Sporisorium reilianum f. sp. reilianum]|uniref:Related to ERD1 protein, required for retention of luminal ER n=1 Tax=Sporisorium reilianum f. sp. reilianum TaxID=72559 RepID=A0A2N8U5Z6_9BASI|nr:related to ERD1 protein, required for retention of luminal ER [Sporisorium reilianum f. sp. reilianum]